MHDESLVFLLAICLPSAPVADAKSAGKSISGISLVGRGGAGRIYMLSRLAGRPQALGMPSAPPRPAWERDPSRKLGRRRGSPRGA